MIQGGSQVNKDIPPYAMIGRQPISYMGINSVGLNRRGYTQEQIETINNVYRTLYFSELNFRDAIAKIEAEIPASAERDIIVGFVKNSPRGIVRKV